MKFSEEQVKEIVALRENMLQQIDKHQEGIEMLEKNIKNKINICNTCTW